MKDTKWVIDKEDNVALLKDNNEEIIASVLSFCGRLVLASSFLEYNSYIKLQSINLGDTTLEANKFLHSYCLDKIHEYTQLKFKLPQNSVLE